MVVSLALKNREVTSFNLSIGTGLALESLFTPTAKRIDETRLVATFDKDYSTLYVSMFTLVRNIIQAAGTDGKKKILNDMSAKSLLKTVEEEMEIIKSIGSEVGKKVIFTSHEAVSGKAERDLNRKPTQGDMIIMLYRSVVKELKIPPLKTKEVDSIYLTSLGFDLLSFKGHWIKSHKGDVLPMLNFNTVYKSLTDMDVTILPFCKELLLIFGDRTGLIPTGKPKLIKDIYSYLLANKVNPRRSEPWVREKIRNF